MKISFKVNTQKKTEIKKEQTNFCFDKSNSYEDDKEYTKNKNKIFCIENGIIKELIFNFFYIFDFI